jgi:hypothetical protein
MLAQGLQPGTAHQVHRTARTAFGEAFKRGYITRNPVALAKPPRVEEAEVDPFEADEIERILTLALGKRNGVRFVIALALGLRQCRAPRLRRPLPQDQAVSEELQAAPAGMPAGVPADLHQPCPLVARSEMVAAWSRSR